jgi:hypothetical protein
MAEDMTGKEEPIPLRDFTATMIQFKRIKSSSKTPSRAREVLKKIGRSLKGGSSKKRLELVVTWLPLLPAEILTNIINFLDVASLVRNVLLGCFG